VVGRALHGDDFGGFVGGFAVGGGIAREAGFDGVEIHAGNGYLIDQFLHDGSNTRRDEYGGSVQNRARFLLDIVDACIGTCGPGRVGVHLSPYGKAHSMTDTAPDALFEYVAQALGQRRIAFIFVREAARAAQLTQRMKQLFGGPVVVNERYDAGRAQSALDADHADAVAFGKPFIANPDLVARLKAGVPLNEWDSGTFYSSGPQGYTDYPCASVEVPVLDETCS
jgi:2,4-dienoyl-CoA reductase-like NADH-dependent reductase (Old Yellow Enzyme family)